MRGGSASRRCSPGLWYRVGGFHLVEVALVSAKCVQVGCYRVGSLDLVAFEVASVWGGCRVGRFELAVLGARKQLGRWPGSPQVAQRSPSSPSPSPGP